jgi:hypothetical protein
VGDCLKKIHALIKQHEEDLGIIMPDHALILVYKAYLLGLDDGSSKEEQHEQAIGDKQCLHQIQEF